MLKEVKMFTIICDSCGKDVNEGQEICAWNDNSYVQDIAYELDWEIVDEKHYCTDCFEYDDNDELIIN